ncbi:hypothetical protein BVX97_05185 [bacterium E08(2017)]|nr:hypothetical protein BVX97_05185 [bacterium E08(2017)]
MAVRTALAIYILFAGFVLAGDMKGPWEAVRLKPEIRVQRPELKGSYAADVSFGLLHFYQNYLGVVIRSKCAMLPSCSNYSIEAIEKHGAVVGCILTCDRLIHEGDELELGEMIWTGEKWKILDEVENNDFWWFMEKYDE